jgi:hypothetical protein
MRTKSPFWFTWKRSADARAAPPAASNATAIATATLTPPRRPRDLLSLLSKPLIRCT